MTGTLPANVPDWEDEYLDRVSDRIMHNYDLEKDVTINGERFDLGGEMRIESEKHFFHPALNYANHESREYLYARRQDAISVPDLEELVSVAHDVAEDRVEHTDTHFSTDVTLAIIVPKIDPAVEEFVESYSDRNLLRFGFNGHYEINLLVSAPERKSIVASENADVWEAFRTWEPIEKEDPGLFKMITRRMQI